MARNDPSTPVLVRHVCSEHGERIVAPATSTHWCKCGALCTVDVADWVATTRDHYPDRDVRELAAHAQLSMKEVEEVLSEEH